MFEFVVFNHLYGFWNNNCQCFDVGVHSSDVFSSDLLVYSRLPLTTIYFLNSFVAKQYCTREVFSYLTTLVLFFLVSFTLICTNGNVAVVVVDG